MSRPLFLCWLLNPPFWHMFARPHATHPTLKWGNCLKEHVGVMLSSMLYQNTGLNWYIKAQKINLDCWWYLFVGRYCWIKSTTLSCLLILAPKRCMLYCLLVCGGHRCKPLVSKFVSNFRFFNMLKIAHKHPQGYWNPYPLLIEGLDLGLWASLMGYLFVQMVIMPFSPVLIIWQSTLFWLHLL